MINRKEILEYIRKQYHVEPDYPWRTNPNSAVLRHKDNGKWFALIMDVQKNKIGLEGGEVIDVVNLKCDPVLAGAMRSEPGILPAYHMNKEHWITVVLDSPLPVERMYDLIDLSYNLTKNQEKKAGQKKQENIKK